MLSDEEVVWLINAAKRWRNTISDQEMKNDVTAHIQRIEAELEKPTPPLELLIICPRCHLQHVDEGRLATKPHRDHACQGCGLTFQASGPVESIGVQFFKGYKNEELTLTPTEGSKPVVGLPTLLPGMSLLYTGQKVRFREEARELGYNTEKDFVVAAVAASNESKVQLKDNGTDWIPVELLEDTTP
jgi:hypothetical protein